MTPELKAELRRLRRSHFYYIGRNVPDSIWKDRDGTFHNMPAMELGYLQACIRLITNDIETLSSPRVSRDAAKRLEKQASIKREELRSVFSEKSYE
jgi:hypothetical protein